MTDRASISFTKPVSKATGTLVVLAGADLTLGPAARGLGVETLVKRAAETAGFNGKAMATLDLIAPADAGLDRLVVIGTGKPADLDEKDWVRLGGAAMGALGKATAVDRCSGAPGRPEAVRRTGGRLCPRHAASGLPLRQVQEAQGGGRAIRSRSRSPLRLRRRRRPVSAWAASRRSARG